MDLAFFSFVTLSDATPADHRVYNQWHQLDHRPENLALPGVAWGDRWGRPEDYKAVGTGTDATHAETDYVAMYWFRSPLEESVGAWDRLGEDSFQWGRGPLLPGVHRNLLGFFRPVKGYAAASALVSPEVLPFRPNRGLHVTLTRHEDHHSAATHARHTWEDRRLIPALLDLDGVAGAWTFSFSHHQKHTTLPMKDTNVHAPSSLRLRLVYLDGEPLETTERIRAAEQALTDAGEGDPSGAGTDVLLSTPVRTIIPWQDW
ncbi:hypothetical protein [Nocardioides sp. W7]|uniref:hypothetical protein n=1 Tax=Nocardioides sp. W7 TaxID=2931390 RepID=UPI001FD4526C|nr:hypothetical protein [Nocardioides sp. W7]